MSQTVVGKGKKILVCDDESGFLTTLRELLTDKGYEPIAAETGKECLEKFAQFSPDLVVFWTTGCPISMAKKCSRN